MSLFDLDTGELVSSYNVGDKGTIVDSDTGEIISYSDYGERDVGLHLPYYNFAWLEAMTHHKLKNFMKRKHFERLSQIEVNGSVDDEDTLYRPIKLKSFREKDYYHSWLFRVAFFSIKERDGYDNPEPQKFYIGWNAQKLLRQTQTTRCVREIWRAYPELRQYIEGEELL
ncbi:hypothetical protein M2G69_04310 [Vibrio vulnificus]|nr:hypothetical protein [Vibrio vulnificus]